MSVQQNSQNLLRNAVQISEIGNPVSPNMSRVSENVLNVASPNTFNLSFNTKTDQDASDRAQAACMEYEGVEGLRRLQKDQQNRSYFDPGCGWVYKASSGVAPEINRGSLGTAQGPSREKLGGGTKWYWDLDTAERDITTAICTNVTKCKNMAALGKFANVCGYCKTTGGMIPVVQEGGRFTARYNSGALMCEPESIVTAGYGSCPTDGFTDMNGRGYGSKYGGFSEGFAGSLGQTADDLFENCSKGPLSRDCVVLAARLSGCSDKGTLITSLSKAPSGANYDVELENKLAFKGYKATANPNITPALVKDGSTGLQTALNDFQNLLTNTTAQNHKLRASARDLCLQAGEFDNYNFCSEINTSTIISEEMLKCIQDDWKRRGGTENGRGYNSLKEYVGKSYQTFLNYMNDLETRIKSSNKSINVAAIFELLGIDTNAPPQLLPGSLPRNDDTRGAETVWIDLVNATAGGSAPVILFSDLRLAKDGEVLPSFNNREELVGKYGVPADNIALTSAFEIRLEKPETVQFQVTTDDGFMIGRNQNPFEKVNNNDWGSWRYQGPTTYSRNYGVFEEDGRAKNNVIVSKWFQGGGLAVFNWRMWFSSMGWVDPSREARGRQNLYLTQEPLAPWLQYEVCTRPNDNQGNAVGFYEKRWNGTSAYAYSTGRPMPSFDVSTSGGITYQTNKTNRMDIPGGKAYMSLTSQSWWHTRAMFGFTAFKTITLLLRPMANLANSATVSVFHHVNFSNTFGTGLYMKNQNGNYSLTHWVGSRTNDVPIVMNKWNLIVLQYIGDKFGVRNVTCHSFDYDALREPTGQRAMLQALKSTQGAGGAILYRSAVQDRQHSGQLILGGTSPNYKDARGNPIWLKLMNQNSTGTQSFTGDVAWIHGFRTYIDSDEMIKAEINQSWLSRWPRGNIDGEPIQKSIDLSKYIMYGNWIGRDTKVQGAQALNDGTNVFMFFDGRYTKMVTEDNKQAKYYEGNINAFDPNKWNLYPNATGNYLLKINA